MQGDYYKPGAWNAICDICGFRFKSDQLRKNWKNEMVCSDDFELRHPQEFIRVRPERIAVPWARPEGADIFIGPACFLWDQSAYAGLGTAGCMQAGFAPMTSQQIWNLKYPSDSSNQYSAQTGAIPGYAFPGRSIPSIVYLGF